MKPMEYIEAARVPEALIPQSFGLWEIARQDISDEPPFLRKWSGFDRITFLFRWTDATMHKDHGETVMEDSLRELRRHLPIWLKAKGHILISGLGLGCVVRGLLASSDVDHVTVVEIDKKILQIVGKEFEGNTRVTMIHGDALTVDLPGKFDCAWHDIWTEGNEHLQVLHAKLIMRFHPQADIQGAWQLPRELKRRSPDWLLR